MKIYRDIKQGTQEWFDVKKGHMTASHATAIMANGKGLQSLVEEIITDYYSSDNYLEFTNRVSNKHIDRGNEFENKARAIYELETGLKVDQVGFIELDEYIGYSPDGLVGEDGLIEIKNPANKEFMRLALTGKIDTNHYNQMQMGLYVTGRQWCDYFVFNPNYKPCFIKRRIYPDQNEFVRLKVGLDNGKRKIKAIMDMTDKMFTKMKGANYEQ